MKRPHYVQFGPAIPVVQIGDFSNAKLTPKQMSDLWWLCGPSAERNMRKLEMWEVIVMAYYEGLSHGTAIMKEDQSQKPIDLRGIDC